MGNVFLLIVFGCFIIFSYTIGIKNGQKIVNNKPIETPQINPIKIMKKISVEHKQEKEQEKIIAILNNIDNYDGTEKNQQEV